MDEMRFLHHPKVLGDGLSREFGTGCESGDGSRAAGAETGYQAQTRLIAQGGEETR